MNSNRMRIVVFVLAAAATAPVFAQDPATLPVVQAHAILQAFDCDARTLPSQRLVGAWTGQNNFAQVYATRERLMSEVGRACQRPGVEQVNLVVERQPARDNVPARMVAVIKPRK
ncbi:MAG: hypothetical protein ABI538_14965 [Pseudoxanthomonas sp.]